MKYLVALILMLSLGCNVYFWRCAMEAYQHIEMWTFGRLHVIYEPDVLDEYCKYEWRGGK